MISLLFLNSAKEKNRHLVILLGLRMLLDDPVDELANFGLQPYLAELPTH
jgi:hypothetical protein